MVEMKRCPDCAELVQPEARICRYCRFDFETQQSGDATAAGTPGALDQVEGPEEALAPELQSRETMWIPVDLLKEYVSALAALVACTQAEIEADQRQDRAFSVTDDSGKWERALAARDVAAEEERAASEQYERLERVVRAAIPRSSGSTRDAARNSLGQGQCSVVATGFKPFDEDSLTNYTAEELLEYYLEYRLGFSIDEAEEAVNRAQHIGRVVLLEAVTLEDAIAVKKELEAMRCTVKIVE